jgi:Nif-specific regulatory protein
VKARLEGIKSITETLSLFLREEQRATRTLVSSLLESVKAIQGSNADRRFQRVIADLKALQKRSDLAAEMACGDYLEKLKTAHEELQSSLDDCRLARVITSVIGIEPLSLKSFCEALLDSLVESTGATRAFLLFYLPESTEAAVIAARNFQTDSLSVEEYAFSRTLLRETLKRDEALLIADASCDPLYSNEVSVVAYELKSVLVAPIRYEGRNVGAIYLDNRSIASAFDDEDRNLLERVSSFAALFMHHARLVPAIFHREKRVFLDERRAPNEILGRDPKMLELVGTVHRIADIDAAVLIQGESGTGKELVARALHAQGKRRDRPFVAINCPAIPESLLESELFGHEKGAYTGAAERFIGHVQEADGGTLFLDEVSELAYPMQAKLLRFLQSQEFRRLGGTETIKVNVRVVAATSKDLKALAAEGKFQEALYYRLSVIPLHLPALRDRKQDIPLLADYFIRKFSEIYKVSVSVDSEVYDFLVDNPFPGNVRELENLIHRMVALAQGDSIGMSDLPADFLKISTQRINLQGDRMRRIFPTPAKDIKDLQHHQKVMARAFAKERRLLAERAIKEAGGNVTEAAKNLGIHRVTLYEMLGKSKRG